MILALKGNQEPDFASFTQVQRFLNWRHLVGSRYNSFNLPEVKSQDTERERFFEMGSNTQSERIGRSRAHLSWR